MINLEFNRKNIDNDIKLSAIFKADNFVYTVFDLKNNILAYSSNHSYSEFENIVNELNPSETKIAVKTTHFGHFGDQERIPFDSKTLFVDKMTGKDIWCAYESPFTDSSFQVRHFSTLIDHHYYLSPEDVFHIHFDEQLMHFYIQKDNEMLLYNSFPFEKVDDLLYYHSFILQSLDINPDKDILTLSGIIEHNSTAYFKLAPFHNKIEFASIAGMDIISDRQDLRNHHFFDHYVNMVCA